MNSGVEDLRHLHQEHKDPRDEDMEEVVVVDRDVVPVDDEGDDDDEVD